MSTPSRFDRRSLLLGGLAAAAALGAPRALAQPAPDRRYLFVIGATGGASILDSFLPVREGASANGASLTTFSDSLLRRPTSSNLDCVALLASELSSGVPFKADFEQSTFLERHGSDVAVMTVEGTSVNHVVAQERALTGAGINAGRNILEAVGVTHGAGLPLPVVNMMVGGYAQPGRDRTLPLEGRQVAVQDPRTFAFGTDGARGLTQPVDAGLLARARAAREQLEQRSPFGHTFAGVDGRARYLALREQGLAVESADLIHQLMLMNDSRLPSVGLSPSPDLPLLAQYFPALATDPFEAQAALAFLLVRYGVSVAVGVSVSNAVRTVSEAGTQKIVNAQLAFDYSHTSHRVTQNAMWSRILRVTDGLTRLLKATGDTAHPGSSLWERSLVYIATDFGREKQRPAAGTLAFGTGHHLNNGVVLVSPRLKGNRIYGGVDPSTCLTYGFDRVSGAPRPGTVMSEGDVYSAVCGALGVSFPGQVSLPALLK